MGPALPLILLPADCGETAAVCSICAAVWTCQPAAAYGNGEGGSGVAIAEEEGKRQAAASRLLYSMTQAAAQNQKMDTKQQQGRMNAG